MSYVRDRRNTYGENDKGSRKSIPRNKALSHRKARLKGKVSERLPELDLEEIGARMAKPDWRKAPDEALGDHVRRQMKARVARVGGKEWRRKQRPPGFE